MAAICHIIGASNIVIKKFWERIAVSVETSKAEEIFYELIALVKKDQEDFKTVCIQITNQY